MNERIGVAVEAVGVEVEVDWMKWLASLAARSPRIGPQVVTRSRRTRRMAAMERNVSLYPVMT